MSNSMNSPSPAQVAEVLQEIADCCTFNLGNQFIMNLRERASELQRAATLTPEREGQKHSVDCASMQTRKVLLKPPCDCGLEPPAPAAQGAVGWCAPNEPCRYPKVCDDMGACMRSDENTNLAPSPPPVPAQAERLPGPCPCCGGGPEIENTIMHTVVRCVRCGLQMRRTIAASSADAIPETVAAWNRRAPSQGTVANGREQIFEHKFLDPACIVGGCKSLALSSALRSYRRAQRRMLDRWSEGDENVKRELWRDLHACEAPAEIALGEPVTAPVAPPLAAPQAGEVVKRDDAIGEACRGWNTVKGDTYTFVTSKLVALERAGDALFRMVEFLVGEREGVTETLEDEQAAHADTLRLKETAERQRDEANAREAEVADILTRAAPGISGTSVEIARKVSAQLQEALKVVEAARLGGVVDAIMEVVSAEGMGRDVVLPIWPASLKAEAPPLTVGLVRALDKALAAFPPSSGTETW